MDPVALSDPAHRLVTRAMTRNASALRFLAGLGALLGLLYGARQDDIHLAEATLAVSPVLTEGDLLSQVSLDVTEGDVAVTAALARSSDVQSRAERELGRSVEYSVAEDRTLIHIRASATARTPASATASAVAASVIAESELRTEQLIERAEQNGQDVGSLLQFGRPVPELLTPQPSMQLEKASDPVLTGLIGSLAGVLLGLALAVARERSRTTVATADAVEHRTGVPVVGVLPATASGNWGQRIDASRFRLARQLLRAVQITDTEVSPVRTLVIDVDSESDGQAGRVVAALATAASRDGQLTVAIDAQSGGGSLHDHFEVPHRKGLAAVLSGDKEPIDVAAAVDDLPLRVIPAGDGNLALDAAAPMGRLDAIVAECGYGADVVLIAASGGRASSELTDLLAASDRVYVSVTVDSTTYDGLERLLRLIAQHGARVDGLIVRGGPLPHASWPGGPELADGSSATPSGSASTRNTPPETAPRTRRRFRPASRSTAASHPE